MPVVAGDFCHADECALQQRARARYTQHHASRAAIDAARDGFTLIFSLMLLPLFLLSIVDYYYADIFIIAHYVIITIILLRHDAFAIIIGFFFTPEPLRFFICHIFRY